MGGGRIFQKNLPRSLFNEDLWNEKKAIVFKIKNVILSKQKTILDSGDTNGIFACIGAELEAVAIKVLLGFKKNLFLVKKFFVTEFPVVSISLMDQISIKTPNPKCQLFFKIDQ
jgi:hypothetical protein